MSDMTVVSQEQQIAMKNQKGNRTRRTPVRVWTCQEPGFWKSDDGLEAIRTMTGLWCEQWEINWGHDGQANTLGELIYFADKDFPVKRIKNLED